MSSMEFEPAILALERLQTYALDRTATAVDLCGIRIQLSVIMPKLKMLRKENCVQNGRNFVDWIKSM